MIIESFSEQDTYDTGFRLAQKAAPGMICCLDGDLGAGKTVFARGFARGLGIGGPVTSPTFTILKEYREGRLPLYHFDVYRIGDPDELYAIGFEEYFYGEGVCLIEWSELIPELIPADAVRVVIGRDPDKGFDYRKIEITP